MKYPKILLSLCLLATLALSGCAYGQKVPPAETQGTDFRSILAKQSEMKKFANAEELKAYLESHRGSTSVMNQSGSSVSKDSIMSSVPSSAPALSRAEGFGGGGAGVNFSTTNVQVQGVDEADVTKTDGNYIYAVTNQNLVIVKAVPADKMETVSTTKLADSPQEIYVSGNTLITFGWDNSMFSGNAVSGGDAKMASFIMPRSSATFLAMYDISDRSKPQLIRRLSFEGNYVSSRLIGSKFYFITANYQYQILESSVLPRVYENGTVISSDTSTERYAYPSVYYIDTPSSLDATTVSLFDLNNIKGQLQSQVYMMPSGQTVYSSTNALYLAYTKYLSEYQLRMTVAKEIIFSRLNDKEKNLIDSISKIDSAILSEDEKLGKINQIVEGYFARLTPDEQTKASTDVEAEFNRRYPNIGRELEKTVVHKISYSADGLSYVGSGEVIGHLLNQYSLDEYQGNLRLATTRSRSWFMPRLFMSQVDIMPQPVSEAFNNVYVLDGSMKTIGQLEDLAPTEQIYAARFVNDRAYLVTFKQTDPLFVIDLSKPVQPLVIGEVKLPGFSNYLHPYDTNTLIGIGREAIDKGDQGVEMLGLKISLFDVAGQPKELSTLVLGGRGSDSVALYDYKAVLFDRERKLLAIPVTLTKKNSTDYTAEFQGIIVFNVSPTGITERGRVGFRLPQSMNEKNQYIDDSARRSLFIGTNLYSFSSSTLKANRLDNLVSLKTLDLPRPEAQPVQPVPYALPMGTVR